jgi:hypothetical protein
MPGTCWPWVGGYTGCGAVGAAGADGVVGTDGAGAWGSMGGTTGGAGRGGGWPDEASPGDGWSGGTIGGGSMLPSSEGGVTSGRGSSGFGGKLTSTAFRQFVHEFDGAGDDDRDGGDQRQVGTGQHGERRQQQAQ